MGRCAADGSYRSDVVPGTDAAYQSVAESAPLELYEPECDEIKFEAAVAGLHSLNALYDTATSNDNFYQLLFYSNAFVATYVTHSPARGQREVV
jgi:hypothetical protein